MLFLCSQVQNKYALVLLEKAYPFRFRPFFSKRHFVCDKGRARIYVQACYLRADEQTVAREFGAYAGIPDNFPKFVVSMDEFDLSRDGIIHKKYQVVSAR